MSKKLKVNAEKQLNTDIKTLKLKSPVKITFDVLKIGVVNKNFAIYDKKTVERICENVNLMTHEIHNDANEKGGSGIIIGRTISAKIDKKGIFSVTAEIEKKSFKGAKSLFTLIPVGIGTVIKCVVTDYDFSCFFLFNKKESAFYKNGKLKIK